MTRVDLTLDMLLFSPYAAVTNQTDRIYIAHLYGETEEKLYRGK